MRKCRLIVTDPITGSEHILYQGSQKTHMERMHAHLISKGRTARIECDVSHKRRPRINSITGVTKRG